MVAFYYFSEKLLESMALSQQILESACKISFSFRLWIQKDQEYLKDLTRKEIYLIYQFFFHKFQSEYINLILEVN